LRDDRRTTQRELLLSAMTEVLAREGYAATSIAQVIAAAGVSRRKFYEHFRDKDDCFLAAVLSVQERLRADLQRALADAPPERGWRAAIEAVVELAATHPAEASLLTSESLAAGPGALELRDQGLTQLALSVEAPYSRLPTATAIPDISTAMFLGGIYRLLGTRVRRGEENFPELLAELRAWVASYEQPLGEHRWRALEPIELPPAALPTPSLLSQLPPPRSRPRLSEQQLSEDHRRRILLAIAELAAEKGYRATTLAEIQRRARIDASEFHRVFADKQEAFAAVHEEHFQQVTAATAGAFFSAGIWPERIWESGRAFAAVMEQNPTAAHVGFVEVNAAGPRAVRRNDELVLAFTLFLQEGYEYRPRPEHKPEQRKPEHKPPESEQRESEPEQPARGAPEPASATRPAPPSRVALEAIAATNFEIAYRQVRAGPPPRLAGLLAHVTDLCLAPFVGPQEANRFIDRQLELVRAGGKPDPP
jgi:AcrR family transcriptional regulator